VTEKTESIGELFSNGNAPKIVVLAGGTALHAVNVFIGASLMPSVVRDIGGLELFSWSTTLFIVASIIASIFAAVRPFGIGPRGNYLAATGTFALGSLLCGLAPDMVTLLVGRTVQGFGAGLIVAMTYAMVRIVFPERLWTRTLGLNSAMWGAATLVGPAIGGIFAEFDAWRWAFYLLVPAAAAIGFFAIGIIPKSSGEAGLARIPYPQIVLIIGAMLAISLASLVTADLPLAAALLAGALAALALVVWLERTSRTRLLPAGAFSLASPLAALFGLMMLLQFAITSDIFVPYFLQSLHGQSPLIAGYLVAMMAVGWSTTSVLTSGWTGERARALVRAGPVLVLAGAVVLAIFVPRHNLDGSLLGVLPVAVALIVIGTGMGATWPHMTGSIMQAAPAGEKDVTTAAVSMAQPLAAGLGAAVAGMIVNLAGLARAGAPADTVSPALWLYGLFALVPLLAIPLGLAVARWQASSAGRIAEAPAE
jgi:MFS family permease